MNAQVQKVIGHPATLPTGVGVLSFGVGVGLGFILGRRTKKSATADLHVLPTVDLDLKVDEVSTKKLDSFIIQREDEAAVVIETMHKVIEEYGSISIHDLKELLGVSIDEDDDDWGWKELDYSMVEKVKGGYMLILPDPIRVDDEPEEDQPTDWEKANPAIGKRVEIGKDFIKNRFALPDIPNDDDLVEVEADEAEDEESEEEEAASEEEEPSETFLEDEGEPSEVDSGRRANAFATAGDTWDLLKEQRARTESAPYVLHKDEFYAEEKGYAQHSLTYYAGDQMMVDENDEIVYDINRIIGELKWGHGSGDPLVFYVRNDKFRAEYEITHVDGLFSVEVMGSEIESGRRAKTLEHSDEPLRFRNRAE